MKLEWPHVAGHQLQNCVLQNLPRKNRRCIGLGGNHRDANHVFYIFLTPQLLLHRS